MGSFCFPPAHVLTALVGEVLQALVVLLQVDRRAAPGVHHLLGGDPAGGLLNGRLGLTLRRLGRFLPLLGRVVLLLPPGGVLRRLRRLGGGLFFGLRLVVYVGVDLLDGVNLVVLGQILKHNGQLLVAEGLHVVLGGVAVLGQDIHDLLGGQNLPVLFKVLGYLMDRIFRHHIESTSILRSGGICR